MWTLYEPGPGLPGSMVFFSWISGMKVSWRWILLVLCIVLWFVTLGPPTLKLELLEPLLTGSLSLLSW